MLKAQSDEYQSQFLKNTELNHQSLESQRELFLRELHNQKLQVMKRYGKNMDRTNDPFYRMERADIHLADHGTHYELKASVPEHDREHVRVLVNDNKVIFQGQRRFQDQAEHQGRKIATQSFQSFREELPLERPVAEKHIQTRWENGFIIAKIPKL